MVYDIVLGRGKAEREKLGLKGTLLLGKHYVKMGQITSLSQPVYLDLNKAHIVFVAGKRGSGKSYCLGVIAEGIATLEPEFRDKLAVILLDTMGIYWTMKYPNHKDEKLLGEWGYEGKGLDNVKIFTPHGFFKQYKEEGIPTDVPFAIKPSELAPDDWWISFDLPSNDPVAVFIEKIVLTMKKEVEDYDIREIIETMDNDTKEDPHIKNAAMNRFEAAEKWGLFSKEGTPMKDLAKGGQVTILDLSCYAMMPNGWKIKALAVGLVSQKLFIERMAVRKEEERQSIQQAVHYISATDDTKRKMPIIWIMIDEAHEFIPNQGSTAASKALVTLLREGRQPGIAMVLATQQPGKIHTDAMTQSDIILAHRLTAKIDTDALGKLLQSYLRTGLDKEINDLPRVAGAAIAIDDVNERLYPMRIRPRFSWHGGSAPGVVQEHKDPFKF